MNLPAGGGADALGGATRAEGIGVPDTGNFDAIFLEHYPRVVGIIRRVVHDRSRADDLAADVFWKLHRHLPGRNIRNIGAWLYRAAVTAAFDAVKMSTRRRRHEIGAALESTRTQAGDDPLSALLESERQAHIREALSRMKPRQARLLMLRASGLSYQEVASALKLNPRSVGVLLARAEDAFERQMAAVDGDRGTK